MSDSHDDLQQRPALSAEWNEKRQTDSTHSFALTECWHQPIRIREIIALILLVLLADVAIYRSHGYAGPAALFLVAPLLLFLGMTQRSVISSAWLLISMLTCVSVRLFWCGSPLAVLCGGVLLFSFAMSLVGLRPYLTRIVVYVAHLVAAGHRGLHLYLRSISRIRPGFVKHHWFAVVLPSVTLVTFTTIFVLANPDLVKSFGKRFGELVEFLQARIRHLDVVEGVFCFGSCWLVTGMLRPNFHQRTDAELPAGNPAEKKPSPNYSAYRNTLFAVVVLFAAYLPFEFATLWFRTFPKGFHYSGYAHEGAAWLTVALGLAMVLLSLIFRGSIQVDPRLPRLKILSWIWSVENLLLAMAVFNRLFIYVGFNGMTQMRVIGFLGAASVVVGLLLVLRKIARNHGFVWLIRRQLWTVSFAVFLYAILPVDAFVNRYNVDRILAGDSAPSVQISVHPTSDEGWLQLRPLVHCPDAIVRDGIRAILDEKLELLTIQQENPAAKGWTAWQLAQNQLLAQLTAAKVDWQSDVKVDWRSKAIERFKEYAYQWY